MAISKDSSTAAVDDTPKTQFCRRGRPTYFLVRPNNGSIVPLIPADQIGSGYRFANLPYSIDVTATVGMTNLGVVANDGGVFEIEEAAQQQSAGSTSDAEHNVRNDQASTDAEQVQLPPKTPRSAPRHAPRGPKQKGFCRKWVTFGCCKFGPDCFNRHGMPETLIELKAIGLHNWPGWFRYKNPDLFEATKPAQSPAKIGKYTVTAPTFSAAEHGKHLFVEDANTKRENAVSVTDGKHENCACGQHNVASVSPATSTGSRSHQALTMATKASSVETPRAASLKQPQSLPEQSYQKSAPAIDLSNHQKPTSMHSPNHAVARQNPNQVLQNVLPTTANPAQVSLTLLPQHHRGPNRGCAGRQFYRTRKPKRIDVMRRLGNASLSEASPAINEAERDEKRESQESKIGSRGGHRSDGSISCQMRVHEHETTDGVVQEI